MLKVLAKVNLFPEMAGDDSPPVVKKGVIKTIFYSFSTLMALVIIVATYTRPNSTTTIVPNPTPTEYLQLEASNGTGALV